MNLYLLVVVVVVVGVKSQLLLHHDSCNNRCFTKNDYAHRCQCNYDCETVGNCCGDFWTHCRGSELGLVVTQKELNTFVQSIWDNDVNRIDNALYSLNYQGQTTLKDDMDKATSKLIQPVDGQLDAILASPNYTYNAFIKLLDNYAANVQHVEHRPHHEIMEENNFWDKISQTQIMQLTFRFLVDNGFIKSDMKAFRTVINELWFELYPKAHSTVRSDSGFEHIMVGEKPQHHNNKTATVTGFNNWVHFYDLEKKEHLDYNGYIKHTKDPHIATVQFTWNNALAHGSTFFVGTSPEFDMALFTVCGLAFPNKTCSFTINGQHINIETTVVHHKQVKQLGAVKIHIHVSASAMPATV